MKSLNRPKPAGHIYKISHPMINGVYIGQTVKSPKQRLKEHIQNAYGNRRPIKGTGALYEVIRAFGPEQFKVETLERVERKDELNGRETYYQKEYDSIRHGLNRVKAPQTESSIRGKIDVKINGKLCTFSSRAELCREVGISYTSLSYWTSKRQLPLEEAVRNAMEGAKRERKKGFMCFRKHYKTYTELAQDKRANRHKLSGREIAARVRSGMKVEEAVSKPKKSRSGISVNIDGNILKYPNIADAYSSLSKTYELPAYSAVVQRIEKGETPEEAFGFEQRPWKKKFMELFKLEEQKGYQWVGELKSWSMPVVLHQNKEIFASKRDFAKAYGLEYTETSKKLKKGDSPEKILRESGHLSDDESLD
ncbi:GIY-YIG nuclease family protein [Planctomycetota bacterium]